MVTRFIAEYFNILEREIKRKYCSESVNYLGLKWKWSNNGHILIIYLNETDAFLNYLKSRYALACDCFMLNGKLIIRYKNRKQKRQAYSDSDIRGVAEE